MPFSASDAVRHNSKLTESQAKVWAKIANGVREQCIAEGGSASECDGKAIRIANFRFSAHPNRGFMPLTIAGKELLDKGDLPQSLLTNSETGSPVTKGMTFVKHFNSARSQVIDRDKRLVRATINTDDVDDYSTVILPQGVDVDEFLLHPSVLYNHDVNQFIGRGITIERQPKKIDSIWQFVPPGVADPIWILVDGNFIRGYSMGFLINDYSNEKVREGQKGATITSCKLREFSLTPVPVDPYAISQNALAFRAWEQLRETDPNLPAIAKGSVYANGVNLDDKDEIVRGTTMDSASELQAQLARLQEEFELVTNELEELDVRAVGGARGLPLDMESAWDAGAARKAVAKWASKDGSGDKDKMNWGRYRRAFVLYNSKEPESFGSYKMPFATVKAGKLTAVWRGVVAASVVIRGGRNPVQGFDGGDVEGAKRLLAHYYKKAGKTPPWSREEKGFDWLSEEFDFINSPEFQTYELDTNDVKENQMPVTETRAGAVGVAPFDAGNQPIPQGPNAEPNKPQTKEEVGQLMEALAKHGLQLDEMKQHMAKHNEHLEAIRGHLSKISDGQDAIADAVGDLVNETPGKAKA